MYQVQVIGESCLDVFVYCNALRLAPDLPIPILQEIRRTTNPGMAANVHRNIASRDVKTLLTTNNEWEFSTKMRYVHEQSNHTFLRVDSLLKLEPLSFNLTNLDSEIVVISDYDKGFLSEDVIDRICQSHSNVFLDTKKKLGPWAERAKFIKINDYEYQRSLPNLSDKLLKKIIHTKGSQGCDYLGNNYTTPRVEVRDTSGAGDSFMAALVVSFLQTGDIVQSIKSANLAASRVVAQRGVGVI